MHCYDKTFLQAFIRSLKQVHLLIFYNNGWVLPVAECRVSRDFTYGLLLKRIVVNDLTGANWRPSKLGMELFLQRFGE